MHTRMYACMYTHTHTCMYTHTHTHRNTHVHTEYMCTLTYVLANQCTGWGIETRAALKEERQIRSLILRQRLSSFGGYEVYIYM